MNYFNNDIHYDEFYYICTLVYIIMAELRVKEILRSRGENMEKLAADLGITPNTLTRNLKGNPTMETLQKIANILKVEFWELFVELPNEELTAFVDHKGHLYKANTMEELERIIEEIKKEK